MKNLSSLLGLLLHAFAVLAQAPQGISHQAVIRDASNQLVTESPIGIQVSIIQGTPEGTVVYSETHTPTSNANGLISFVIGQGTLVSGVFAEIDWADGPYFIETQTDPAGGTNYTITGTSQILSVPYALHSNSLSLTSPSGYKYAFSVDDYGFFRFTLISDINCPEVLTDFDGNIYSVVKIGVQCWMKENLKTTHYRNGTPIENPTSNSAWANNTSGAYAWYDNDINWKDSYGALYNWYAVDNSGGLCPDGWHLPSDLEWSFLIFNIDPFLNFFAYGDGIYSNYAGAFKSIKTEPNPHPRWDSPNAGATNETGWSGLPGGYRSEYGNCSLLGSHGYWWSSSMQYLRPWMRGMYASSNYIWRGAEFGKEAGKSIRCVKD